MGFFSIRIKLPVKTFLEESEPLEKGKSKFVYRKILLSEEFSDNLGQSESGKKYLCFCIELSQSTGNLSVGNSLEEFKRFQKVF